MSMPGWRRRSWSMALWPPLAAYLPKVWSMHSYTINDNQQFQQHQNARHQHLVLTWGLWLLLDFESWLVDHCPALLLPSIYDHVKGHIMILVIMFGVGNSQNFSISHPLQIPQDAGSPQGQRCHCMGIVGLNIMKLAFREISVCFRSSFIHGIYELIHLDVNL